MTCILYWLFISHSTGLLLVIEVFWLNDLFWHGARRCITKPYPADRDLMWTNIISCCNLNQATQYLLNKMQLQWELYSSKSLLLRLNSFFLVLRRTPTSQQPKYWPLLLEDLVLSTFHCPTVCQLLKSVTISCLFMTRKWFNTLTCLIYGATFAVGTTSLQVSSRFFWKVYNFHVEKYDI